MADGKFVSYVRVSTQRQGASGLGLEAQQSAVRAYLNGGNWELIAEFTEIESGKKSDRPELRKALEMCRKQDATLVIAKLDRLARNVAFVANLMETKVKFVACDNPNATPFTIHIYAAIAEQEGREISARTKAALRAAKARGKKLGFSIPSRMAQHAAAYKRGAERNAAKAKQFAENITPVIREIQAAGLKTLEQIAKALNARGIKTARGSTWYPATVAKVLTRSN